MINGIKPKGIECSGCGSTMNPERFEMGFKVCVKCSTEEKKMGHVIYPHKTGGYVQPVSSTKKKHLDSIDRRSSSGVKPAKGIMKDASWDRWLKQYWHDKYNPKPERKKVVWKSPKITYISMSKAESMVRKHYDDWGYHPTLDYCKELFLNDKISMVMKNQLTNMITDQQMLPKRLRKWVQKIK